MSDQGSLSRSKPAVDAMARARVPGWLRFVDAAPMAAVACWAVYTHHTVDALALCLAYVAAIALSLSPRFPLEARCLIPSAWGVAALSLVFCAELAWSKLTTGAFILSPKPIIAEYLDTPPHKVVVMSLLLTAYKIATVLLCTERGPSRRAISGYQASVAVTYHLLMNAMIETQRAFGVIGFRIDAAMRIALAVTAAIECGAPLLLLLLTPMAAPARAGAGKAANTSDEQPTSPVAAHINLQTRADTRVPVPANYPADDPSGTSAASHSRANTALVRAAVQVAPPAATTLNGAQLQYTSVLMTRSVPFAAKFPSWHLADHPHLATPEGLAALRTRLERTLSQRASLLTGAPVSLQFVELVVGSGCIVVHGRLVVEGGVCDEAEAEMIRAVIASELLTELKPEGAHVLDGDAAVLQLGGGTTSMELAFIAAGGRFLEGPARSAPPVPPPGVPLLSATWPLLVLPSGGSDLMHLQFGTALLARQLGDNPELVVSWAPLGSPSAPAPLVRTQVATLQAAARARGNPPGLINIDADLGPRPSHGVLIAQLVDGDALLATHSVAVLPSSARAAVAELLRARLPADTLCSVAHDLGVLMCGPRVRTPGDAPVLRSVVLALMASESACRPPMPALRALLGCLLRDLDACGGDGDSPSSSSSCAVTAAATGAAAVCPPLLWCRTLTIVCAVKAAQFVIIGSAAGALAMALHGLPYALALPAAANASARLFACLPCALRTVDRCAAWRVYTILIILATAGATGDCAIWAVSLKYGGDVLLLLGWAAFERPRSPALGAAISLLVELPSMCAFRWYSLTLCGLSEGLGQALCGLGMRAAVLAAVHAAMWWAGTRGGRATKLKAA
ncbi:hypothetical protein FOA52_012167 [Chlamydomonas sp. UWO 241]|nr:hypothetical protein FOA52_012167 [Chlamydomonas sp. UWO 241]